MEHVYCTEKKNFKKCNPICATILREDLSAINKKTEPASPVSAKKRKLAHSPADYNDCRHVAGDGICMCVCVRDGGSEEDCHKMCYN